MLRYEKLAAIHMMRCQHHIRTRRFDLNRATIDTRSNDIVVVLLADSSDVSDIVTQCGQRKVQPVSGRYATFTQVLTFKNRLSSHCDHDSVFDIVVKHV